MSTKNIDTIMIATSEQVEHICANLTAEAAARLPREQAQRIITNGGIYQRRWEKMITELFAEEFEEFYLDLDDLNVSLEDRIVRGNYGYVDPNINAKNFQLTKSGRRKIVLYDPKGSVGSDEMIRRMTENGDRPACLDDALELGHRFPDRQRQNPIVFLDKDTFWHDGLGHVDVPVLFDWSDGRRLGLRDFRSDWSPRCRFAAVRES